jgi:DNA-binding MarR family transcriptional regulator
METTETTTDAKLCESMLALLKRFKTIIAEIAEAHGLTSMQLAALRAISEGYATMGKVACVMHCDNSNVTGIVDRLSAMGLVTRQEDVRDRRVKALVLTDKGQRLVTELTGMLPQQLGCSRLDDAEKLAMRHALDKLAA